jgi:hypothetical protein
MKKLIFGLLLMASTAFGIYTETVVTTNGTTNLVVHLRADHTEFNVYWETGNYTSNIVARLRAEDAQRIVRTDRLIASGRFSSNDTWIVKQRAPKHNHITTNTVHWMRAHPATTNDPYIVVNTWHEWGYVNLYWKEKLTDPKWERIVWGKKRHDPRIYARTKIHMHPESSITKRMLKAKTGFFCQSQGGTYTYVGQWRKTPHIHEKLYSVDLSNFFPKPDTVPSRALMMMEPVKMSSSPPPVPGG